MPDFEMRLLDTTGTLVLDLSEANGYHLRSITMPELVRRRDVVTSPDVEGEVERQSVLDAAVLEVLVSCRGATASAAWDLHDALYDEVVDGPRRYRVETTMHGRVDVWDARRVMAWRLDTDKSRMRLHHRDVSMLIPVQPTPVVDGGSS